MELISRRVSAFKQSSEQTCCAAKPHNVNPLLTLISNSWSHFLMFNLQSRAHRLMASRLEPHNEGRAQTNDGSHVRRVSASISEEAPTRSGCLVSVCVKFLNAFFTWSAGRRLHFFQLMCPALPSTLSNSNKANPHPDSHWDVIYSSNVRLRWHNGQVDGAWNSNSRNMSV